MLFASPHASAKDLKNYMHQFLDMAADLADAGIEGSHPNWSKIDETVKKMKRCVSQMRSAVSTDTYRVYIDRLSGSLDQITAMSREHDLNVGKAYDHLSQSCMKCHSAHLTPGITFREP